MNCPQHQTVPQKRAKRRAILVLSALFILSLTACSTFSRKARDGKSADTAQGFVGPIDPSSVAGPLPQEIKEVVVVIGPGMSAALSGIGVIRALHEEGIRISGIAGMELGSFVAAAFSASTSVNSMEWPILQFKKEWVLPRAGLSRLFSSSKKSAADLQNGLRILFPKRLLESLKVPTWTLGAGPRGELQVIHRGPADSALCTAIAHSEWMEECPEAGELTPVAGALRDQWESQGLRMPVVWVIPPAVSETAPSLASLAIQKNQQIFSRHVQESRSINDLEVYPSAALRDYFDFDRRSELIYSGKREAKRQIGEWMLKLGWSKEKKSR